MLPKDGPYRPETPSIAIIPDHLIAGAATFLDAGFDRCLSESFDAGHLAAVARALTRRSYGLTLYPPSAQKIGNDVLPIRNIKRCGYFLRRFSYPNADVAHDSQYTATHSV
jgi:DNA-binding response OmpR family regulator